MDAAAGPLKSCIYERYSPLGWENILSSPGIINVFKEFTHGVILTFHHSAPPFLWCSGQTRNNITKYEFLRNPPNDVLCGILSLEEPVWIYCNLAKCSIFTSNKMILCGLTPNLRFIYGKISLGFAIWHQQSVNFNTPQTIWRSGWGTIWYNLVFEAQSDTI